MADVKVHIPQIGEPTKPKQLIGVRHYQCLMMFVTIFISFGMRTVPSVTIISMTDKTPPDPSIPTYPEWDNTDIILSSFFWGYIMTQLIAGQLCEYFGPKWFLCLTVFLGSVANIVIPAMAAALGPTGVIVCRVFQGLNQGFLYPCIQNLMSRWTPLLERSKIIHFVYGGANIGIAVGLVGTGAIAGSKAGWPMAFYTFGGIGLVWCVIFGIFAQNSPRDHKSISEEERIYIESNNSVTVTAKKIPTPWRSIFTSVPVWAMLIAGISQCFGDYTMFTEIPSYMNGILNFDINSNSQLSALPYVGKFLMGLIVSPLFDRVVANGTFSITVSRKVSQSFAQFLPAAALITLAFLETFDKSLVTALLIIAVSTTAFQQSGYLVNMIDITPNHTGTIFGLVNGINNIFSILAPLSVGLLGDDKTDPILWRKVFLLAAGVYIACGIFYAIFTSAEVQTWNDSEREEIELEKKQTEGKK